jgi:hypothetical protein
MTQSVRYLLTSASGQFLTSTSTSAATLKNVGVVVQQSKARTATSTKKIENAVLTYVKAMRSLGHTRTGTEAIARALDLPRRDVDAVVRTMGKHGVKVVGKK